VSLILAGEALAIYAEISGAKIYSAGGLFNQTFLRVFVFILFGSICLLVGYMLGYRGFRNIWIVSAISITGILIIEPSLNYTIFHQLPTKGALIGLILGAIGFVAALFI
jgi:hypothetical protein